MYWTPIQENKCETKIIAIMVINLATPKAVAKHEFFNNPTSCEPKQPRLVNYKSGNTKGRKYHCTIDLLFDQFGLVHFANKNKNCP
jgi:hypothetical protein